MSGELNGTKAVLQLGTDGNFSTLLGQAELTATINNQLIEITSKSDNDFVVYMNGENSTKGISIPLSVLFNSSADYRAVKQLQRSQQFRDFKLSFNDTDEVDMFLSGMVNGLSDALPMGDKVVSSFSVLSTGEIFRSQYFSASGSDRFITSDGKELRVRYE